MMRVDFNRIFSAQELEILRKKELEGKRISEIAEELNKSRQHIFNVVKRIKTKIKSLQDNDVVLNLSELTAQVEVDIEIENIFNDENNRSLRKKITVNQAAFLQNTSLHATRTSAERSMKSRLGIKKRKDEVIVRKMTDEEREEFLARRKEYLETRTTKDPGIYSLLQQYEEEFGQTNNIARMAELEVALRSYGLIYRTPYINKLNAKTGMCIRASNAGEKVLLINNEDKHLLPADAKFVESTEDEYGNRQSVWIVPSWRTNKRASTCATDIIDSNTEDVYEQQRTPK